MTTHSELLALARQAVSTNNPALAGRVLETCRNELGYTDAQAYEWTREWTGVSLAAWNQLIANADDEEQCH